MTRPKRDELIDMLYFWIVMSNERELGGEDEDTIERMIPPLRRLYDERNDDA
jgi:hypothetical protein